MPLRRRKAIEKIMGSIELQKGNGRKKLPKELPKNLKKPLYISNKSVDNLYFYVDSFARRRLSDPETDSLTLINSMLTETLHSRIFGTAREKGLVYNMSSGLGQTNNSSNWWFGAQVMPKNASQLFAIMIKELMAVFEGAIADSDIEAAKQYALGRYQRSGQTVAGTAAGYSNRYFFDEVVEDYYQVPERIDQITKQSIIDVSHALFKDQTWGLGVLGNAGEAFAQQLYDQVTTLWTSGV
jgi:predicted Zn-dependent peptidase